MIVAVLPGACVQELLSQALKRDLVAYEDAILQITLECTWELPQKLPFYAALVRAPHPTLAALDS